ncbi:MAG TPA: hypothetical protein PKA00_21815 [Saprospiraceae bacterium]|nr:hypothetical protein [Saprospiraceae bacterium]HMQ85564.1 hypothetical protein [Saprospiraceae bacterium]
MDNITFQYPAWYILLCLLAGLIYAAVLYYKSSAFREQSKWLNYLLGTFRFLTVSVLAFLLMAPLLKSLLTEVKKPVVVIAQDQSASVAAEMDEQEQERYQVAINALSEQLSRQYELKTYAFGSATREGIDFNFVDPLSNLSDALRTINDLYSNQNLGAVILASDGIYNEGSNPLYLNAQLEAPVYTIALGDTTPKKELLIKRVFHNEIAYLGDKFSIQLDIAAQNAAGNSSRLNVYKIEGGNSQLMQQIPFNISSNDFFQTQEIVLDANKAGVQRFRVSLNEIPGEASAANNSKDIFIDVLDARQKILLLANSPHPDITAIRQALSDNKNYEVTTAFADKSNFNLAEYDLVILHQLPSKTNDISGVLNTLNNQQIAHFFIVGTQTNLSRLSQLQPLVSIRSGGESTNEVQAQVAADFGYFKLSDNLAKEISRFAPLTAPFGEFSLSGEGQALFYQRIGKVDTRYPLLVMGERSGTKIGVLCGEGLWKWRLFDYLQHQNHDIFNELIDKSVQYLSLKEDKRRFRVSLAKNIFNENENIQLDAELYNESFELVNEPDVLVVISDSDGKDYNFTFTRSGNAYNLNAGILPVGDYTFRASVNYNGQELSYNGQFSVQPIQLELYETTADHNLLQLLSEKYGGQMVYPEAVASLASLLEEKGTVKPVIYQTSKTRPLINLKGLFFLMLLLLSGEWFLRRYFGAY